MLSSKVYRTTAPGSLPAYDENRLRARSGLDANRVGDFDSLVEAAIKAFQDETDLKVLPATFTAMFPTGGFVLRAGGTQARLTLPGLNAALVTLSFDGTQIDAAKYRTWADDANGSLHVEPARGMQWDVRPGAELECTFTAGVSEVPSDIQEILGVRIRYDYYAEEGDGLAFIHRCQPYNYLRSQR